MIPLGLSATEQAAFHRALVTHHEIRIIVQILSLNHAVIDTVSDRLLEGSVSVDSAAEVTRTATLTLLDPERSMSLDATDPARGGAFMDNMVRVQYGVNVAELNKWVWVPVFTGPVTKVGRNDALVQIEASGKELLAQGAFWRTATYAKGTNKIEMIKSLLASTGENVAYMNLPANAAKQPAAYSMNQLSVAWTVVQQIAAGMTQQLFYDGRGTARLRTWPGGSSWNFKGGNGGSLVTYPSIDFSSDDMRNAVWVKGAKPAGASRAIEVVKYPPATHPLSPSKIGRNGVSRYIPEVFEDDTITSNVAAENLATAKINELIREQYTLGFEALPVPHLEPGDMATLTTDEFSGAFRVSSFTIPLTTGTMSVGFTKTVSRPTASSRSAAATADKLNKLNVALTTSMTAQNTAKARLMAARKAKKGAKTAKRALLQARAATARARAQVSSTKNSLQKSKWNTPW